MLTRSYINDLSKTLHNKRVLLKGWLYELRDLNKIKFILLRDFTGVIQLVALDSELPKDKFESISKLSPETVIEVIGIVKINKEARKGYEVVIKDIKVLNKAEPLPIQVFEKDKAIRTDLSTRLDYRSLDLRKPNHFAIFKIQATLVEGMQDYLNKNNFLQIFTPCILGSASESGSEIFEINYYNKKAFLRQDPQLHRQLAIAAGIEKLYDLGPNWRAEVSHTTKHISEHRACAVELAFINDELDIMRIEENLVVSALKKVKEKCKEELNLLDVKLNIPETPFPELRFPKIYDILAKQGKNINGLDLDTEAEKLMWDYISKKYKNEFYFFNRFPSKLKPFYVMYVDEDPEYARSIDLNFKGLELSSGGQREHRYGKIIEHAKEKGLNFKNIEWFTKFFKWGVPQHGGFALGIERLIQNLLNLNNIREATLFPRDVGRLTP